MGSLNNDFFGDGWMESKFKNILFTGSQPLLKLEIGGALYWYIRDALVASINNSI